MSNEPTPDSDDEAIEPDESRPLTPEETSRPQKPGDSRSDPDLTADHPSYEPAPSNPADPWLTETYEKRPNRENFEDKESDLQANQGDRPGSSIANGKYKLIETIGEGGMGSVWRAQQTRPVRREVAIKLIKQGMDSKSVVARFDAERQALALMEHPNIARILDGGVTSLGQPFFAMELVRGLPLTEFCDQERMTIKQRLELFVQICSAIQHAHQKGIIHRDLKPGNILVIEIDGKPVPKVIDFGLAKALGSSSMLTDHTLNTAYGMVVGTPLYMAPEQMDAGAIDIDTRADVYALGVILYELLTGSTPLDRKRLREAVWDEVRRIVREEEPLRPSSRLSSVDTLPSVAATRQVEPASLHRIVRGDLDWIVMKSLEKDRNRRYETANGFAADVLRYLTGEAVFAAPPSTGYRVKKFLRKHRAPVIAASLILVTLIAGIIGTTWFAIAAEIKSVEAIKAKEAVEATLARSNYFLAIARWDANRVAEANNFLDRIPHKYRQYEWRLARRQFGGGYGTCYGHKKQVTCVNFSPDGSQIVSGSWDKTLRLWDSATCNELSVLRGHTSFVTSSCFSSDGKRIVSGSEDGTVRLWKAATGELVWAFNWQAIVSCVCISPDDTRIAAGSFDKTLQILDSRTGQVLNTFIGHTAEITTLDFSPDGLQIVTGSEDGTIKFWDAITGKERLTFKGHDDRISGVCFSPDGNRIGSASDDGTIKLWNVASGEHAQTVTGHTDFVTSIGFSPDGTRLVSGGMDNTVRVWEASSGKELRVLKGHAQFVSSIGVSPDSTRIVSGSWDGTAKLWNVAMGDNPRTLSGHTDRVSSVSFSPDGLQLVSGGYDNTIFVWDAIMGKISMCLKGHVEPVSTVNFSVDGTKIVSGSFDNTLRLWNATSGEELQIFKGHTAHVTSVSFHPEGEWIVSGSDDQTIRIWRVSDGKELGSLIGHTASVTSVDFSPDGSRIVSGSEDNTLKLWDTNTGEVLQTLIGHEDSVTSVKFSPNGLLIASASWDLTVHLWDATTGQVLQILKGHSSFVRNVNFSPDAARIISGSSDQSVKLWDVDTGEELRSLEIHQSIVSAASFSPDGLRIVSASFDKTVRLWDSAIVDEIQTLKGHMKDVYCVCFSPDSSLVVSGSEDDTLKLWNPTTGEMLLTFAGHADGVSCVCFHPNGLWILSASLDNTLMLWDAHTGKELRVFYGASSSSVHGRSRISALGFSSDGTRIYGQTLFGEKIVWDFETGDFLDSESWKQLGQSGEVSNDGRWFASSSGVDVLLVKRKLGNLLSEFRDPASFAAVPPLWHTEQANLAIIREDWFACTFHQAWLMKNDPELAANHDLLHMAYRNLRQSQTESHIDANGEMAFSTQFVPQLVEDALRLPRGDKFGGITAAQALASNNELWTLVKNPKNVDDKSIQLKDLDGIKAACEHHPRSIFFNTLGTAWFRMGEFQAAIDACNQAIELAPDDPLLKSVFPGDYAIIAMSYLQLGNQVEAELNRKKFEESMNTVDYRDDAECKGFALEIESAFAK